MSNSTQYSCPECRKELVFSSELNIYFCNECKRGFTDKELNEPLYKSYFLKSAIKNWARKIGEDENNWEEIVFSEFPSPIAHEYFNLRELFIQADVYGSMFQLKEVIDIIMKFIAGILLSDLKEGLQKGIVEEKDFNEIIKKLLEKPLAMGDWKDNILFPINNRFKDKIERKELLKLITNGKTLFNKAVTWRNDYIGHGALRDRSDTEFINKMEEMILELKKYFSKTSEIYRNLELYSKEEKFIGYKPLKKEFREKVSGDHVEEISELYIKIKNKDYKELKLYPFIRLRRCLIIGCGLKDIFVFECKKRKDYYLIDYARGHKIKEINRGDELKRLWKEGWEEKFEESLEQDSVSRKIIEELERLSEDFHNPDRIIKRIREKMDEKKKGLFCFRWKEEWGKQHFQEESMKKKQ